MPLKLFEKLLGRMPDHPIPAQLYLNIASQSRDPIFYDLLQIEDSVMGRTDMLTLHVFLFTRRLKYVDQEQKDLAGSLSQDVFDLFVLDLERGLREIGFADGGVHKRKKKLVRSYYAMVDEFDPLLDRREPGALAELIEHRFYSNNQGQDNSEPLKMLEHYMFRAVTQLENQTFSQICSGQLEWPLVKE